MQIIELLDHMVEMHRRIALTCVMRPQHTIHEFVRKHGRQYETQVRPHWLELGTPKECLHNAHDLAITTGLTYVEGFMLHKDIPILIHHAWCVDGDLVIDPTIANPENRQYFGIAINSDFLYAHTMESEVYGLLDNYRSTKIYETEPKDFLE